MVTRFGTIALLMAALLPVGPSGCGDQSAEARIKTLPADGAKPNIIFIMVDTLRADRVGAYGHTGGLTPNIDAIAAEGVVFERAVAAAPWTLPSIGSLFSSCYPSVHKATSYRQVQDMVDGKIKASLSLFNDDFITPAERLQESGYVTAAFVSNKFIQKDYGFAQGFDHFDGSFADNTVPGSVTNAAALKWLRGRDESKPFYLYLHYMDIHGPYDAPPAFLDPLMQAVEADPNKRKLTRREFGAINQYIRKPPKQASDPTRYKRLKRYREYWVARYEAGISEFDHHLGDLIARLEEMDLWDDAYVILTADHGESLCEHKLLGRAVWDHGYSQYDAELHVPLILRAPGMLPAGVRFPDTVRLIDAMPTVLDQLGMGPVSGTQGQSLLAYMRGQAPPPSYAFAEGIKAGPPQQAVYQDIWKLMLIHAKKGSAVVKLYNLLEDPGEQKNLAKTRADVVEALLALIKEQNEHNRDMAKDYEKLETEIDPETARKLAALGYWPSDSDDEESDSNRPGAGDEDTPPATSRPASMPIEKNGDTPREPGSGSRQEQP